MVAELGIDAESTALDVAAGTGKFTRLLVPTGARVLAVEPVDSMRRQLALVVPEALPLAGTAESIPLRTGAVDAITVAQAFHWFKLDRALPELHRVLSPGGSLGLIWNRADTSVGWVAHLNALSSPARNRSATDALRSAKKLIKGWRDRLGRTSSDDGGVGSWVAKSRAAFASSPLFRPLEERFFRHGEETDADRLVDWVSSFSKFSLLTGTEQRQVADQVRQFVAELPPRLVFPFCTDVFWTTRR